ncbi:MAG: transposase, partial [Tannerella sp.]|nr:transposase [Tannerella sp.]
MIMFAECYVRKKQNRSGSISVVIVDKSSGKCRYLKTVGISSDEKEIAALYQQGKKWITVQSVVRDIVTEQTRRQEEKLVTEHVLENIENISLNGTQMILNQVLMQTGFDAIEDSILKHLVVSRICQPSSKSGTVDYLKS